MLVPSSKTAIVIQLENASTGLSPNKNIMPERLRTRLRKAKEGGSASVGWYTGDSQINGRKVIGCQITEDWTIWADADSLLPLQAEYSMEPYMGLRGSLTVTDIDFNMPLDAIEFSTDVPEDYSLHTIRMEASEPSETDLIEILQMSVKAADGILLEDLNLAEAKELIGMLKGVEQIVFGVPKEPYDPVLQQFTWLYGKIIRGLSFVQTLPRESNWCYSPENNDTALPVFWYRPEGSESYRVIYDDLTVVDRDQEEIL